MLFSALFALSYATLVLAAPTTAPVCAVCPAKVKSTTTTSAVNGTASATTTHYWLVNHSNSGPETPTYCGYNTDETHPWPLVMCYFSPDGEFYSSTSGFQGCPASTSTSASAC